MNIEFLLYAKFDNKRVIPIRDRLFKAIVSSLNEVNIKKGSPLLVNGEVPEELVTKLGVDKSKIKIVD